MSALEPGADDGVVLVIGAGGIGGPAAIALVAAGARRVRVVDPDVVEPSNLPRQILFDVSDVGRAKARVAAERLGGRDAHVEGVVGSFAAETADALLRDVVVAIDATDGAATKDTVLSLVVARRIPLVHASALGGEGRLLDVAPGGRPCVACLFGYGSEGDVPATDTCARVGVWPAVPGAIGALAAHAAIGRLRDPAAPTGGLVVVDFATPRAIVLQPSVDAECPACGDAARAPRPTSDGCGVGGPVVRAPAPTGVLDLRDEACPMNLLRARRALDATPVGGRLAIWLGAEGAATVPGGVVAAGHRIRSEEAHEGVLRLLVERRPRAEGDAAGARAAVSLRRFARQIVLPDLGEEGQRRIGGTDVVLRGDGPAADAAAAHLAAAGVRRVEFRDGAPAALHATAGPCALGGAVGTVGALARFDGAALADAVLRAIVAGDRGRARLVAGPAGHPSVA